MEWTKSETLKFIQLLEVFPCLWNKKNKDYKNRRKRREALEHLAREINTNITSIEKKIISLRTQYNREIKKIKTNLETGLDDMATSNWYAFDVLHFLKDHDIQRPSTDSFTITFAEKEEEEECAVSPVNMHQKSPNLSRNTIEEIYITQQPRSTNRRNNSQINSLNFSQDNFPQENFSQDNFPQENFSRDNYSQDVSNAFTKKQKKDDFSIFGEVVASELRDLKTRKQVLQLKKRIMDLIYETKLNNLENA